MCGIAGIFHFAQSRNADKVILKKMTDAIAHRGPDAEGFFVKNNIGLGHRRLSIIDLSTGQQPMFSDDKTIAIVFNGEIYNYIELKEELKNLGHHFYTTSDTEVVIHSYQQWGFDCQNKFNGMWAFALWDEKQNQLFLSRDRMGEKPLYYGIHDNTFVFGSEIKSILEYGFPAAPNLEMLEIYLTFMFVPAPFSFYKNINKLRPAHYLIVKDGVAKERPYWDLPVIDEQNMNCNKADVYEKFNYLLTDAVKIRMRSDVPFGAFLSGGLDSSSVVALMSENSKFPVETFTIGFKEKIFDERELANDVAKKFKTNHHEYIVEPESFDDSLKKILFHYDEPFGDSSAIPTGFVSKFARQKVKMVLTGDGGDEVLSGYPIYQSEKFAANYQRLPKFIKTNFPLLVRQVAGLTRGNARYLLNRAKNVSQLYNLSFQERLPSKMAWGNRETLTALLSEQKQFMKVNDYIQDFYATISCKNSFYQLMYFHLKVSLPEDMLTKVDRMSMAYSLETRVPFLDHRLIELMVNVSKDVKMQGYERKSVLRNTIGKKLPQSILTAPKKGFGVPLREWFKDKAFDEKLQTLYQSDFGLNQKIIKEIVEENKAGKRDSGNFIWMLFVLKNWLEKF